MRIVKIAIEQPYASIALAALIVVLGLFGLSRSAVDIFPAINIPIIASVWGYDGLPADEMASSIVLYAERRAQTLINDLEHTESQSLGSVGVIKYFFQPYARPELAYAQITGVSQTQLHYAPPGTAPPLILKFDASTVPILQLGLTSESLTEAQIFDLGVNQVRAALSPIPGASVPYPYGGKQRAIQVDLDPAKLRAYRFSAADVVAAINQQNLTLPAGTEKVGGVEYQIKLNASPIDIAEFNDIPLRLKDGTYLRLRDVAYAHDGASPQTNIVRLDGHRAALMTILKTGSASTLDIVRNVKKLLPQISAALPDTLSVALLNDQSVFVESAVQGVLREGAIAAGLTCLLILLLLGNWRAAAIVGIAIPLSVLASIAGLSALGESINIMTLGGLALATGILIDDATVTMESITWHLGQNKSRREAIIDGANQIATPALVSTLAICIVFVPFFFLSGITKYLFVPLAEAVIGAMLASYLLSRTLLPTLAMYGLGKEVVAHTDGTHRRVQQLYDRLRERYASALRAVLGRSSLYLLSAGCALIIALAFALPIGGSPGLGSSLFPKVDAGQMKLHIRAPTGTRIESTAAICDRVEARIRSLIPSAELLTIADNIGLPYSAINTVYSNSAPIGPGDADILISLRPGHRPTAAYIAELRAHLPEAFPDVSFAFLPADIISQILNFGTPVPIDVQIRGNNVSKNRVYANALLKKIRQIPDAVDVRVQQAFDYPELHVDVDRAVAQQYGVTQQDVARSLLLSLSGSFQTEPQFWTEKSSGSQYNVNVQSPQYRIATFNDLAITPIDSSDHPVSGDAPLPLLADMATFRRAVGPAAISHYNSVSTIDIFSDVQSADLGTFMRRVGDAIEGLKAEIPKGTTVTVRGQAQTMVGTFHELVLGTGMALVLIYLLIMVNFQSWKDPLIIIATLPFALVGVIAAHFFTGTTPSVPSLIGTIMCMGIATANSILVVSFAREQKAGGAPAAAAAITAGVIRLRPVLMTALAMIVGMLPAAIGFGEGGEQNAPLGRAVIGGLIAATLATLFLVPALYGLIHRETS